MDTSIEKYEIDIPKTDLKFFRSLAKKMEWKISYRKKSGIQKGLDDIKEGRIYHAKDASDMIKQILG